MNNYIPRDVGGKPLNGSSVQQQYIVTRVNADNTYLNVVGDQMYGNLAMNDKEIRFRSWSNANNMIRYDAGINGVEVRGKDSVQLVTSNNGNYITCTNDTISFGYKYCKHLPNPVDNRDATTKEYVDSILLPHEFLRYLEYKFILDNFKATFWLSAFYHDGIKLVTNKSIGEPETHSTTIVDISGTGAVVTGKITYYLGSAKDSWKFRLYGYNRITSKKKYDKYFTFFVLGSKDVKSFGPLISSKPTNGFLGWLAHYMDMFQMAENIHIDRSYKNDASECLYIATHNNGIKNFWKNDKQLVKDSRIGSNFWGQFVVGRDLGMFAHATGYIYEVICFSTCLNKSSIEYIKSIINKYHSIS